MNPPINNMIEMLTISKDQMQIFDAVAERDFHRELTVFLRQQLPEQTGDMTDQELRQFIREAQGHASRHGIKTDRGIAQYICLALETTPAFADDPAISKYLHLPGMDPELLLEELVDVLEETPED